MEANQKIIENLQPFHKHKDHQHTEQPGESRSQISPLDCIEFKEDLNANPENEEAINLCLITIVLDTFRTQKEKKVNYD